MSSIPPLSNSHFLFEKIATFPFEEALDSLLCSAKEISRNYTLKKKAIKFLEGGIDDSLSKEQAHKVERIIKKAKLVEIKTEMQDFYEMALSNPEMVKIILKQRDPVYVAAGGVSLLHLAAAVNDVEVFKLYAKILHPDSCDEKGRTPLLIAARFGALDCIKLMLENPTQFRISVNHATHFYEDIVQIAIESGQLDVLSYLYENRNRFNITGFAWPLVESFHLSIEEDFTDVALFLMDKGLIDLNYRDLYSNKSALDIAIERENITLAARILRDKKFKPHLHKGGYTPLHRACTLGNVEIVSLLQKHLYLNPMIKHGFSSSPLLLAAQHKELLGWFFTNEPRMKSSFQWYLTSQNLALFKKLIPVPSFQDWLLDYKDINGYIILEFSEIERFPEIVKLLDDEGLIDRIWKKHFLKWPSLLNFHTYLGSVNTIEALLALNKSYIDVNAADQNGLSPLAIAISRGFIDLARLFLKQPNILSNAKTREPLPRSLPEIAMDSDQPLALNFLFENREKYKIAFQGGALMYRALVRGNGNWVSFLFERRAALQINLDHDFPVEYLPKISVEEILWFTKVCILTMSSLLVEMREKEPKIAQELESDGPWSLYLESLNSFHEYLQKIEPFMRQIDATPLKLCVKLLLGYREKFLENVKKQLPASYHETWLPTLHLLKTITKSPLNTVSKETTEIDDLVKQLKKRFEEKVKDSKTEVSVTTSFEEEKNEFASKDIFELLLVHFGVGYADFGKKRNFDLEFSEAFGCPPERLYKMGISSGADLLAIGIDPKIFYCLEKGESTDMVVKDKYAFISSLPNITPPAQSPIPIPDLKKHIREANRFQLASFLSQDLELPGEYGSLSELAEAKKLPPKEMYALADHLKNKRQKH